MNQEIRNYVMQKMSPFLDNGQTLRLERILENPSVGLLLCATKNDEVVEYSMSRTMSPMMVAEYQLQLPDKEILQKNCRN